jgi:hypothetical protein
MLHDKISSILFVSYVTALFSGVARATCYYPDGCVSLQDTPCSDDTEHSTCCGQGYACLSNKMCMATGEELQKPGATVLVRGSCTDKDWRSSECPLFCINPATDNMPGGMGIRQCENNPEFYFCNNSQGHDCDTAENVLLFKG